MPYRIIRVDAAGAEHDQGEVTASSADAAVLTGLLSWIAASGGSRSPDYVIARPA